MDSSSVPGPNEMMSAMEGGGQRLSFVKRTAERGDDKERRPWAETSLSPLRSGGPTSGSLTAVCLVLVGPQVMLLRVLKTHVGNLAQCTQLDSKTLRQRRTGPGRRCSGCASPAGQWGKFSRK